MQNIRNFTKEYCILYCNCNIGRINRNLIISPNRPALTGDHHCQTKRTPPARAGYQTLVDRHFQQQAHKHCSSSQRHFSRKPVCPQCAEVAFNCRRQTSRFRSCAHRHRRPHCVVHGLINCLRQSRIGQHLLLPLLQHLVETLLDRVTRFMNKTLKVP